MNKKYWDKSFVKQNWFADQESLPLDAVEQITTTLLALHQRIAAVIEKLDTPLWHEHAVPYAFWHQECASCGVILHLMKHIRHLCADISGMVMDFYNEPEEHQQLERAVRLYAWSLFLIHSVSDHIIIEPGDGAEYAEYRLEELYGESLIHKYLEEEEYEGQEPRLQKTSDAEKRSLVEAFLEVYTHLSLEFQTWRKIHPHLTSSAFPAPLAPRLLQCKDACYWQTLQMLPEMEETCTVVLALYEWDLLALLLESSAQHATFCRGLREVPSVPKWIPREQQRWDGYAVVQSRHIWKGMVVVLDRISDHFASHGCDDGTFAQWVPDGEMRRALMKRYHDDNGDPEVYAEDLREGETYQWGRYGSLTWYLARRIEAASQNWHPLS